MYVFGACMHIGGPAVADGAVGRAVGGGHPGLPRPRQGPHGRALQQGKQGRKTDRQAGIGTDCVMGQASVDW